MVCDRDGTIGLIAHGKRVTDLSAGHCKEGDSLALEVDPATGDIKYIHDGKLIHTVPGGNAASGQSLAIHANFGDIGATVHDLKTAAGDSDGSGDSAGAGAGKAAWRDHAPTWTKEHADHHPEFHGQKLSDGKGGGTTEGVQGLSWSIGTTDKAYTVGLNDAGDEDQNNTAGGGTDGYGDGNNGDWGDGDWDGDGGDNWEGGDGDTFDADTNLNSTGGGDDDGSGKGNNGSGSSKKKKKRRESKSATPTKARHPIKKRVKKLRTCNPTLPWARQINKYNPKLGMGGLEFRKITYECWEKKLVADQVCRGV
jgi:hypothetical protein